MTNSTKAGLRCPICGETAPEPAWICLYRAVGSAIPDQPCSYSIEGDARVRAIMQQVAEEAIADVEEASRARAAGVPVEVGGEHVG